MVSAIFGLAYFLGIEHAADPQLEGSTFVSASAGRFLQASVFSPCHQTKVT
jgi:hypothetical protein